jgi:chromosome segregation ATPase
LLSSLPEQLRSLQSAVEQLSAHVEHSQQAIDSFLPAVQQLEQRLSAVESSSVSADVIKGLRGEMSRLSLATQQKERLLTLNMTEVQNLRRQVTTLEATLKEWPASSGL